MLKAAAIQQILAWAFLALAAGTFPQLAQAQADAQLERARQFMAANDAKGAYALLAPLEAARAGEPEFDYLLGIAALDSGQIVRAIFALERVLAAQPGNALARAEIARAYVAAGENDTAQAELAQVRASPIPQNAVPAVDRVLNAIGQLQAQQATQVRGYIDAGFGHDTNVNSATGSNQVAVPALGGTVVSLDPASTRASDNFALLGGGVNVRVPIAPDLAFAGNIAANQTFNHDQGNFDFGTLEGSAGLAKTVGSEVFSGAVQANAIWVGGSRFRDAYGLLGQWQHNLGTQAQTTVFAQLSRLSYPGDSIRDANRSVLGAGYARELASGPVIFASAYAGREDELAAGVPQLGHRLFGVRAGLQMQVAEGLTLFGSAAAEERRYGGDEPLFNYTRRDHQTGIAAGMYYMLAPAWRLTPQVSYTDNNSNIPIYDFRRVVASVTLRREF